MPTPHRLWCAARRWITRLATSLALLCTSALAPAALAAQDVPPLVTEPVADGVWFVQGEAALGSPANRNFISNAGFIVTPAGVVVIDALGSPALAQALLDAIRKITPQPVRYVIVTHYHADHIYGLQVFKDHGATIIAQQAGRNYLNSETAQQRLTASRDELAPWIDANTHLVPADRWLDADTVLDIGGERLQLRHVGPAHTPEDLVVYAERSKVLFAGDLVFRGRIPFVGQADSRSWITALNALIQLQPSVIVPGHGGLSTSPLPDLTLTRDYLEFLRRSMGEAATAMEPFDEAYARTDWSAFAQLPLFRAANRINAYNTYLLMEQQGK